MKDIILRFLFLILAGEIVTLYLMNGGSPKEKVLAESTVATSTPSPILTETPSPTPSATPKPTPAKTLAPTPVPVPKFTSQQINEFIDRFAGQYGVDPNVIRHIALCESGFNPGAINYVYKGLFQFGSSTWQNIRRKMGEDISADLRVNAEEAVQTAAYAISHGNISIWPHCNP